ncbi:leucine-rich repeat domain-containing protein [Persephonella sp.]
MREKNSLKRFFSVIFIFAVFYLVSCGGAGDDTEKDSDNALDITFYPINKYPVFGSKLVIYKAENNFKEVYSYLEYYWPYSSYFTIKDDVVLVEVKGGYQDADEIESNCAPRDKLANEEVLYTFSGTKNTIIVVSPITTALYNFSKGNSDLFFKYFEKLPQPIKDFHTQVIHHSGESENVRNFMYYLSRFVGLENIKKELEDNGLFDGSVVQELNEETISTLSEFLVSDSPFKDKLLEYCVRKTLEKDLLSPITEDELNSINVLECNKYGIRSVEGIEHIPNLTFLSLYSNKIKDISPLSDLENLAFLDIADNFITDYNQVKSVDTGIIFLENNCITNYEEDTLSSIFNLIFGLEYQDKCNNRFYANIFTFEPETKKLKVAVSSKYFEPYTCDISYPMDEFTLISAYRVYPDGKLREVDISSYMDKSYIGLLCSDYCPDINLSSNSYEQYIYFGKNIFLAEKEIREEGSLTCYSAVYVENGKEVYLCYEIYETAGGLERRDLLVDFSSDQYLVFTDLYPAFTYNNFLYLFLYSDATGYIEKILKVDLENLEVVSEILPGDTLKTSNICYQDNEYVYMCGSTLSIYKKEDFTPYKMDILNIGNTINIKKFVNVGDHTYIFAFDVENLEELLYIVRTDTLKSLDSSALADLEDLTLKKIYLRDYFSGITRDPSLRINSILALNNRLYLTTDYWEIIIMDVSNPSEPVIEGKVNVLEEYDSIAGSRLLLYKDYLLYTAGRRLAFYKIQADGNLSEEINVYLRNIFFVSSIYVNEEKQEMVIFGDTFGGGGIHKFYIGDLH